MNFKFLLVALYVFTYINEIQSTAEKSEDKPFSYCGLSKEHTICRFGSAGAGSACGEVKRSGKFTTEERKEILKLHNEYRAKVARGEETKGNPGPQPNAADMLELIWDFELEMIVQRWMDQCIFDHDLNRDSARFRVGQNLAWKWTSDAFDEKVNWDSMIGDKKGWYAEVQDMPKGMIKKYSKYNGPNQIGHYTALVWAESRYVGCGFAEYKGSRNGWQRIFGCNYGPGGNVISLRMYKIGDPASKCPTDYPANSTYNGLCADGTENDQKLDVNPMKDDPKFFPGGSATTLFDSKQLIYLILLMLTVILISNQLILCY